MYREYKQSGLIVQDAAKACLERTMPDEKIEITYAPPDMWSRQKDTGKTMAEVFMMNGLPIVKTSNNRVQGHMQMHEDFADMEDGKPGLMIFSTCKHAINDITDIQADEKNPDDCAKEPHEVTHMVDCVRYYCVSRKLQAEAEQTEAEIREMREMKAEEEEYESYMCGGEPSLAYMGVM
jgi:phage terminase large subunit